MKIAIDIECLARHCGLCIWNDGGNCSIFCQKLQHDWVASETVIGSAHYRCASCLEASAQCAPYVQPGLCSAAGCNNAGRYSSGYCGIHDILLNDAKGTLVSKRRRAVCAECGTTNMDNHYAKVSGKGDLCLACWNKWRDSR